MDAIQNTDASGGGEKRYSVPALDHVRRIQALGAAISRRNWQGVEQAHAAIRDAFDRPDIYDPQGVAALASAPPAPTPEAGSDLAKLSAEATQGEWHGPSKPHDSVPWLHNYGADGKSLFHVDRSEAEKVANAEFSRALVNAFRAGRLVEASASPPPAEDLAGQGEPVAWAYEYREPFDEWRPVLSARRPTEAVYRRNIRPLFAAPAPSRPADREAEAIIVGWYSIEKLAREGEVRFTDSPVVLIAASDLFGNDIAALRDAPRDGGDGWRPIATAPRDGSEILAGREDIADGFQQVVFWDEGCEVHGWGTKDSDAICPVGFFTYWRPLPAPPSPNTGDGTQDRQGGGR